jgi:flagellar protein FliS
MKNPYLQAKIMTASPGGVLLLLYEGLARFLHQGAAALEKGDVNAARHPLGRALAIVQELHSALNPEAAPELCGQLERLYLFAEENILAALSRKEPQPLRDVSRVIEPLYQAWKEAVRQVEKQPARRTG